MKPSVFRVSSEMCERYPTQTTDGDTACKYPIWTAQGLAWWKVQGLLNAVYGFLIFFVLMFVFSL